MPYLTTHFGNPSSAHRDGREARDAVLRARREVGLLIDVSPGRVFFTASGTESSNIALHGALHVARRRGKHVITSPLEHPANQYSAQGKSAKTVHRSHLPSPPVDQQHQPRPLQRHLAELRELHLM